LLPTLFSLPRFYLVGLEIQDRVDGSPVRKRKRKQRDRKDASKISSKTLPPQSVIDEMNERNNALAQKW
jgi:hypothetical protein